DTSGSRYTGAFQRRNDDMVEVRLEITVPPGSFGVFGSSPGDTFMVRNETVELPVTFFLDRMPFELPLYEIVLVATRIPPTYAALAGPGGIRGMIAMLQSAEAAWQSAGATE